MLLRKEDNPSGTGEWSTLSPIVAWLIWKHRNDFIFKGASYSSMELIVKSIVWVWARSFDSSLKGIINGCHAYTRDSW